MTRQRFSIRRSVSPKAGAGAAIAIAAAVALTPTASFAGATVHGNSGAVSVETTNTSVEEILAALGKSFDVHVRSSANLDKHLTGTYEGSLSQVVARVLEGYNFVVKSSKGRVEVSVLGSGNGPVVAKTSTAPTAHIVSGAHTTPTAQPVPTAAAKPTAAPVDQAKSTGASPARNIAKEQSAPATASPGTPPIIKVAEGPMPPMPSPGTATGPVPVATPSNVAAPMPVLPPPGSPPIKGPEPTKSDVQPPAFNATLKPGETPMLPKPTTNVAPPTPGAAGKTQPQIK